MEPRETSMTGKTHTVLNLGHNTSSSTAKYALAHTYYHYSTVYTHQSSWLESWDKYVGLVSRIKCDWHLREDLVHYVHDEYATKSA